MNLGFCHAGGIFLGKNIDAKIHKHQYISVILALEGEFSITPRNSNQKNYEAVYIPGRTEFRIQTTTRDYTAFIHIDPYSDIGLRLQAAHQGFAPLDRATLAQTVAHLRSWQNSQHKDQAAVQGILLSLLNQSGKGTFAHPELDPRIRKAMDIVARAGSPPLSLAKIAEYVHISPSRFSHLFKEEVGCTYREYARHIKLRDSIASMHGNRSLTEASFSGGFADQPHFSKVFKHCFGINPSHTRE